MNFKRMDKWDFDVLNNILSYISDYEENNYEERLKNLSALNNGTHYLKMLEKAIMAKNRMEEYDDLQ